MAETSGNGDLSRRSFLVAAGIAALGLAGLRALTRSRHHAPPASSPPEQPPAAPGGPSAHAQPPAEPSSPAQAPRLRAQVTDACFACGLCVQVCPAVFAMGEQSAEVTVAEVPAEAEGSCREAARDCPAQAIVVEAS